MNETHKTPSPLRDDTVKPSIGVPQQSEQASHVQICVSPITEPPEPSTPTKKHLQIGWHGLLSPLTPAFAREVSVVTTPRTDTDGIKTGKTEGVEGAEKGVEGLDYVTTTTTLNNDEHKAAAMLSAPETASAYGKWSKADFTLITTGTSESEGKLDFEKPCDGFMTSFSTQSTLQEMQVCHEPEVGPHKQDVFPSPTGLRRSTRIKTVVREKSALQAAIASSNKTKKGSMTATRANTNVPTSALTDKSITNLTAAEPTTSPFNVVISSVDNLPVLHSSEWQLQYPPGGSTHPSYPWPAMDPRLVFHSHFVPLKNGLPDVSHMPPLSLPIGWTHVSWAGLLPVAFDPYKQAFKLTPIGAMPLTCEELHQGGLHRYVPGGDLHPEFGLLPDVQTLSDGSDAEVFNFEHVNWALPWATPVGSCAPQAHSEHASFPVESGDSASPEATLQPEASSTHERDCPDNIVDIEDAWRWLEEKDLNPSNVFVPTPAKTWKGTGIYLSSRKTKAPIPSLMALALADTAENPEGYLSKQNGREFCPFKSVATPVYIDITLLKDTEFTLIELLTYFPNHYAWRKGADRLALSGMTAGDIANTINMIRGLPGEACRKSTTINDNVFLEKKAPGSTKKAKIVRPEDESTIYTAEGWTYNTWETTDYPLLGLTHGVVELPAGPDAGPITALIHWCRSNNRYRAMLSDVPCILKEAHIDPLIERGKGACPDKEVVGRYSEALKLDRLRVLKSVTKRKRLMESGEEKKRNRRKCQ